jgi:hypothetical protein
VSWQGIGLDSTAAQVLLPPFRCLMHAHNLSKFMIGYFSLSINVRGLAKLVLALSFPRLL